MTQLTLALQPRRVPARQLPAGEVRSTGVLCRCFRSERNDEC
jgi:hypothetical protein